MEINENFDENAVCYTHAGSVGDEIAVQCDGGSRAARYVYVHVNTDKALTVCEVQVFSDGIVAGTCI